MLIKRILSKIFQDVDKKKVIDLDFLGIDNVLVLRGDPIKSETYFSPENDGHKYASDLINQVCSMNNGKYLDTFLLGGAQIFHLNVIFSNH